MQLGLNRMENIRHLYVVLSFLLRSLELTSALDSSRNRFASVCGDPSYVPPQDGISVLNETTFSVIHCATICLNMADEVCIGYNVCELDGQKQCGLTIRRVYELDRQVCCRCDEIENLPTCVFYRRMVDVWPRGNTVLLQPFQGCQAKWSDVYDTFHTGVGTNSYTDPESFRKGKDEDDGVSLTLYMCIKFSDFGTYDWPAGDYCTLELDDCPTGFSRGEVRFAGPLGTENLYFCCRNDGSADTAVDLPNTDPFYLFRYQGHCQRVNGMLSEEEFIYFDTTNHNTVGSIPYINTATGLEVWFCYYFPTADLSAWPKGTVLLPQPTTGCPQSWETVVFSLHPQTGGQTKHSPTSHLRGPMTTNKLDWYFCEKTTENGPYHWPAGDYCVAESDCPTGFDTGNIVLDMEDDTGENHKVLPVCCRNDGSASTTIDLPTSDPFYLFRYKGQCQKVRGLVVKEEFVYIDTEDYLNENELNGAYPFIAPDITDNLEIHFCYYQV